MPRGQFADNQRELREAIKGVIEEAEVEASGGEAGMGLGSSLCATWTWTTMERVEGWVCVCWRASSIGVASGTMHTVDTCGARVTTHSLSPR